MNGKPNRKILPGIPNKPDEEKANLSTSIEFERIGIPPTIK